MSARRLLMDLQKQGVTFTVDGDYLDVCGHEALLNAETLSTIRENKPEIIHLLTQQNEPVTKLPVPSETKPEPPSSVYRCATCGGTNTGKTGVLLDGGECWGCRDCPPVPDNDHAPECPMCAGPYLVTDEQGKYCVSCRARPWEKPTLELVLETAPIGVRWGAEKGFLRLTNPLTGEAVEIPARGAARWVFDRLNEQKMAPVRSERAIRQSMPPVVGHISTNR